MQLEFKRADRKTLKAATVKGKGNETEQLPLYTNKDSVVGEVRPAFLPIKTCAIRNRLGFPLQVRVANTPGKKVEHQGIKVQLLGQIELKTDRGNPHDFLALGMHYHPLMCPLSVHHQAAWYVFTAMPCTVTVCEATVGNHSHDKQVLHNLLYTGARMQLPAYSVQPDCCITRICSQRFGSSWGPDIITDLQF